MDWEWLCRSWGSDKDSVRFETLHGKGFTAASDHLNFMVAMGYISHVFPIKRVEEVIFILSSSSLNIKMG